ncbi:hypothetical protein [Acinetobacter beijerinckii]|uniref:Uncharacterized protein n=1 Tax=Acinetobacter beijerinckii CIP 110307 TaxID=1217648 RepID=N9E5U7_9GAMM|nr:hypothetical protein [Acinetobacter beijerinckii]ENW05507.1 hypothetical protein F933_02408 [Acinetobacter beijerinckii CIP 110307]MDF2417725.1 hypothetical protein [Acinetobacter beijerinckii]
MLDLIIKALPIFLAVVPLFVWLDKAKRFTHRRKFYLERLIAVTEYIDHYYGQDKEKIEKDCAAQALVCSEKVSHLEVDYVIKEYPQRFFMMTNKLIAARHMVDTTFNNGEIILTANSSKQSYKKKRWILAGCYFLSMIIIQSNNLLVFLMDQLGLKAFQVDAWILLMGTVITLIIGIFVAVISGLLFVSVDALIEIYDDLRVQHVPRT